MMEANMTAQYPVGGLRQPVYNLMRALGFSESDWSDKFWHSADGITVSIYGAGSRARVTADGHAVECSLDHLAAELAALRKR